MMKRMVGIFTSILTAVALVSCGAGVVTPEPTAEPVTEVPTIASTPSPRPTSTAPLIPPADTATPTVTPTPVVHVVQKGETLQAIAFDYGVSVEALQAANGIESPQFLQVGQRLVIPTGEEESGDSSGNLLLSTPTPQPFEIRGAACYETSTGGLRCLGEVVNTTEVMLTNVKIRVLLVDAAGEKLAGTEVFAEADFVPVGGRSPFGVLFTAPPSSWASYRMAITRGEDVGALADSYVPIAVTEVEGRPSGAQFRVKGSVQNTSQEKTAGRVNVIATTYDADGMVTGFREHTVAAQDGLAPGVTASFDVLFTSHGDTPADFNVIALGRIPVQ